MTTTPPSLNQALHAIFRARARQHSTLQGYVRYEALKAEWSTNHPDATSAQYAEAMAGIASACGV